jgi:hypothetical protein
VVRANHTINPHDSFLIHVPFGSFQKRKRTNIGGALLPQLTSQSLSPKVFPVGPIRVYGVVYVKTEDTATHEIIIISDDEGFEGIQKEPDTSSELERHVF